MWSVEYICHIKPGVGRIVSLKLGQEGMTSKILTNEHIYQIIESYLECSTSHLSLGDTDEAPCLAAVFSSGQFVSQEQHDI